MKKYLLGINLTQMKAAFSLFVLFFVLAIFPANSQDNVKVQLTNSSFLYHNVDNPATVTVPGVAQKDIKVTLTDGSIVSGSNGYTFRPSKVGTAVVSVFVKEKLVKKAEFKVIALVAKVNGHKSGDIEKSLLMNNPKITVEVEGGEIPIKFKVNSFYVSGMIDGDQNTVKGSGEVLNTEQINLIKKIPAGDRVLIGSIKVTGSDGTQKELADLVFDLK